MPDPEFQTVSASQMPALFGWSSWGTRWTLWQEFRKRQTFQREADERMMWGTKLQPYILDRASYELRLDVLENADYQRCPDAPIGATIDGGCIDPQRGYGVVETKNVDRAVFAGWGEGKLPGEIELQVQTQLAVPHPQRGMPKWGVVAALVGGNELRLFPREPLEKARREIYAAATEFLASVRDGAEPDPMGTEAENAILAGLWNVTPGKTVALDDIELGEAASQYLWASEQGRIADKVGNAARAKLLRAAEDARKLIVPGHTVQVARWDIAEATVVRKAGRGCRLTVRRLGEVAPDTSPTTLEAG